MSNSLCRCLLGLVLLVAPCAQVIGAESQASAPTGSFVRFRVDQLPEDAASLNITAELKVHSSPWVLRGLKLTPSPVTKPGWTPWVDLRGLPGGANGSLLLSIPDGADGATQFSRHADDRSTVRTIRWSEPDGTKIIITPDFADVRTFRDQERRYYQRTLVQTSGRLYPLTRPPLMFSNAWGYTTGGAAEYMVKSFRLMGFNSVVTSENAEKYEDLYGWQSQFGQYGPPGFMPYAETEAKEKFEAYYKDFFATGKGRNASPGMRIFQLADEPREVAIDPAIAAVPFREWLKDRGVTPAVFEKDAWNEVNVFVGKPTTQVENRLYYWTRKYQAYLTPKMFALAAEAVRSAGPSRNVESYVALSGHALYMPSRMPLDMFQLAQYPTLMPGISDWMTSGSWNWDSHQAVAFSVAPFNAGARRYGDDFGKPPLSFPMMHCVQPSLFRTYTQLANQCKLISYYNYGPDYEVTEGFWSHTWKGHLVQRINNQSAQMDDILGPATMRPSRVAMLYASSQDVWWPEWPFNDKRAAFLALSHHYFQPELVTEEQVAAGALEHYDALYVLDSVVPRATQDAIADWVKRGGLLWACADALVIDEYKEVYDILDQLAGLKRVNTYKAGPSVDFIPAEGETLLKRHEVPPLGRKNEIIRPGTFTCPKAKIRASYSDGHPAWAEIDVGKGKIVFVGHRCGLSYSRRAGARGEYKWWPWDGRRELLYVPLIEAGVERELELSAPLVMASPLSTGKGTVIILYNMFHVDQTDLTIKLKESVKPYSVQWCDESQQLVDLPYEHVDGHVVISGFSLPKTGAMILVRRAAAPKDDRIEQMRRDALKHLASDDWQEISAGAWFAGFFPDWGLAAKLVPLLEHKHWAVRRSAAESLGRLESKHAAESLRAAVDRETDAHALADELYALAQLRHHDAAALCEKFLEHADPVVRAEAERAAGVLKAD